MKVLRRLGFAFSLIMMALQLALQASLPRTEDSKMGMVVDGFRPQRPEQSLNANEIDASDVTLEISMGLNDDKERAKSSTPTDVNDANLDGKPKQQSVEPSRMPSDRFSKLVIFFFVLELIEGLVYPAWCLILAHRAN